MARQEIITLDNGEQIKLTEREKLFCEYYLGDANRNAAGAARMAGLSEKTAYSSGQRMLSNVEVQKYINLKDAPLFKKLGIDHERIIKKLRDIAFTDLTDLVDNDWNLLSRDEIPKEYHAALGGVEIDERLIMGEGESGTVINRKIKYKLKDNIKPLLTLAEMTGLIQRGEIRGGDGEVNQITIHQNILNQYNEK